MSCLVLSSLALSCLVLSCLVSPALCPAHFRFYLVLSCLIFSLFFWSSLPCLFVQTLIPNTNPNPNPNLNPYPYPNPNLNPSPNGNPYPNPNILQVIFSAKSDKNFNLFPSFLVSLTHQCLLFITLCTSTINPNLDSKPQNLNPEPRTQLHDPNL